MPSIFAVANPKGGSGKTTVAVILAGEFAQHGYAVAIIDADPQGSSYQWHASSIARAMAPQGIDLVRAANETELFAAIDDLDRYDVVVIDCPPTLGFLTLSALCAATSVLITVHPQMLDIASMNQFLAMTSDLLSVVKEAGGNLDYDWMRYLITRYEPNDGPQAQIVAFLRSLFGERVLTSMMVKSTAVSDAGLSKQTIYEASRETMHRQTYDRAVEAMDSVNAEIENLVQAAWGRA